LSARCLRLTGQSLQRSTITESQVPSGWQNLLPTWTFLWMRWTQEHFQLTGDVAFAREMLGYLDRNIKGMKSQINDHGLFEMFAWNLFDWAPMDTPADGIVTHINCLASLGLKQSAQLARDVGDESKARTWDDLARRIADAVNRHLWSEAKGAYVDCIRADRSISPVFSQQTQVAAVISGVPKGERAERCRQLVHDTPADFVKAGSPFFMFFLLEALVQERRFDALVETIRDYWGKQTDAGATTFWEMYHDGAARLTRSHCHGWSAAPTFFLTQHVLGVQPATPGYATVLVAPKPGRLAWAKGRVPTPRGAVECAWTKAGDRFELRVGAPPETPLRAELPYGGEVSITDGHGEVNGSVVTSAGPRIALTARRMASGK
jgi:alpha-L-rhamnosidase